MITITFIKDKDKSKYIKGELEISNNSSNNITNIKITCNTNTTELDVKKFDCILSNGTATLTPSKELTIKANTVYNTKCKIYGNEEPTNWKITYVGPNPPSPTGPNPPGPGPQNVLYNLPMTDTTDISKITNAGAGFKYQWSFDQQSGFSDTKPNPKYFNLIGENGLEMNLYATDKPFKKGDSTKPRTEMRGLAVVKDNVEYTYSFDQYLVNMPNFDYCWAQVFSSNGPNLMLRWRSGKMQFLSTQGDGIKNNFNGTPADDVGKWVNWKIVFYLAQSGGYSYLYRNGVLMTKMENVNNSGGNNSYIKHGMYAQQMDPKNDVKMYTKNLMLYSGSYGPTGPTGGGGSTGESGPTGETGGSGPGFNYWDGTQIPYVLNGGMSAKQCDTILSLVSIAENSSIDWSAQYKYCEDIGDGRGFTLGPPGFCTGTNDFLWLVQNLQTFSPNHPLVKLLPALKAIDGTPSHKGIENLPNIIQSLQGQDLFDYITATWNAIRHFYWDTAIDMTNSLGLTYPICKGQLYDISLNSGDFRVLKYVTAKPPSQGGNELTYLKDLQAQWLNFITKVDKTLNNKQPDRALMWQSITTTGNYNLDRPISVTCYGDNFVIN
jgi:chitosanase